MTEPSIIEHNMHYAPNWLNFFQPLSYVNNTSTKETLQKFQFKNLGENFHKKELLPIIQNYLISCRSEIRNNFIKSSDGTYVLGLNSFLTDNLIKFLFQLSIKNYSFEVNDLCIIALGGYGRGEMAPHSDVDILFLIPENLENNKNIKNCIENILYYLWDLGFSVGHSSQTLKEVLNHSKKDLNLLTSLLDKRYIIGNKKSFFNLKKSFSEFVLKSNSFNFVRNKLLESEKRHLRFGGSRYVVEPNVKEGKGGIRDLQTLIWIAKFVYNSDSIIKLLETGAFLKSELLSFADSQRFLFSVRCHLHFRSEREDDNLAMDSQIEIANLMNFREKDNQSNVERFMKRYFLATKSVGDLTRIFCSAIEEDLKKPLRLNFFSQSISDIPQPFVIKNKRISINKKDFFNQNPTNIFKLFHLSHFKKIEIHPKTLRQVTGCIKSIKKSTALNAENNKLFLEIIISNDDPTKILRLMNECKILGRIIPEFQKIVGLIQYDMYHHYTVDEHTIFTISNIHSFKKGDFNNVSNLGTKVIGQIEFLDPLIIALLLHDIAKAEKGDHSVNGANLARTICKRFNIESNQIKTISWLILNHLLLSKTAFKYDLNDEKVIENCAKKIKTMDKLNYLLVLTICDIKAVGPKIWNDWKKALIHELYIKVSSNILSKKISNSKGDKILTKELLYKELLNRKWDEKQINNYCAKFNINYWKTFNIEAINKHLNIFNNMLRSEKKYKLQISFTKKLNATELIVIAPDHYGLFSKIVGIVTSCGFDIFSAKIFTCNDGFAVDTFFLQDKYKNGIIEQRIIDRFLKSLSEGLEGKYNFEIEIKNRWKEIPKRFRDIRVPSRVFLDNDVSSHFTVIEINCKNAPGVLYTITKKIVDLGIQINSATISTYGNRVIDIFYIKNIFGEKITSKNEIEKVQNSLLNIINEPDPTNKLIK